MRNKQFKGHLAIIGANLIWGLYATVCKTLLLSSLLSSWALCGIKMIGGALLFWTIALVIPRRYVPQESVTKSDLAKLFLASMLINTGNQSCIILGLNYTSPLDSTVICSMAPIFTIALGWLLLKDKISFTKVLGIIIGFIGALLFVFIGAGDRHASNPLLGNILMIASQIFGALYLLMFTDVLGKYHVITLMKWLFLFSAIVLTPITASYIISTPWSLFTMTNWLQLAYIILLATGVAYFLLVVGQKSVSPSAIAIYNYIQPITATISSIIIGVAAITGQNILATMLCLIGVCIVTRKEKEKTQI